MKLLYVAALLPALFLSCSKSKETPRETLPATQVKHKVETDHVLLFWDRVADATHYGLSIRPSSMKQGGSIGINYNSLDTFYKASLGPDTKYFVTVMASNQQKNIQGAEGTPLEIKTACTELKVNVSHANKNTVVLFWQEYLDIKGYTVYLREKGAQAEPTITNESKMQYDNLKPGTQYEYKISYVCSATDAPVTSAIWGTFITTAN